MAAVSEWERMGLSRTAKTYIHNYPQMSGTDTEAHITDQWRRYENLCRMCASPDLTEFYIYGTPQTYKFDLVKCWVYFAGWKLSKEWIHFKRKGGPRPVVFPPGYEPHFPPERVDSGSH